MNAAAIFETAVRTAVEVVQAVLPLLAILTAFQGLYLRLPVTYVLNLLKGALLSTVGLWLFLLGIQIGFLPYGQAVGEALGHLSQKWLLIPISFLLGFLTTWAEPAVRILCHEVERASSGFIRRTTVLYAVCVGVAAFVALGAIRVTCNIPLQIILIPGYALAVTMLWFSQREFVAVAFDAGGVATGPMANTFLLGLGLGMASAGGSENLAINGLGLVALIALAPIVSVLALGIIVRVAIKYGRS